MSLPLKARIAIRDHWTPPTSAPGAALASIHKLLGLPVVCEPEWPLLVALLDAAYPDCEQLVLAVAGCVQAWCRAAGELFEAEGEWADEVLERIKDAPGSNGLRIFIEISKGESPSTAWSSARNGFNISLPSPPICNPLEHISLFKTHLISAFDNASPPAAANQPADDWTDVVVTTTKVNHAAAETTLEKWKNVEYLADPETLPRPDDLLLQPPYYLLVHTRGGDCVEVQSSHGPSLELLAGYFKKWRRANNNMTDRPPLVNVKLQQSPLGLGLVHDNLTIFAENRYGSNTLVSPTPMLSIIEGVLGYERIYCNSSTWHFRKDGPLKR